MAKFVNVNLINNKYPKMLPADYGYIIVPIYDSRGMSSGVSREERTWIEENIKGEWSSWHFGNPGNGQSFAFKLEDDAFAFKLRWV